MRGGIWEDERREEGRRYKGKEKEERESEVVGATVSSPLASIRAKFGIQDYIHSILFQAKFSFDRYIHYIHEKTAHLSMFKNLQN